MKIKNIIKILKNPKFILLKMDQRKIITLSDKKYIELNYEYVFDKKINLKDPKEYNEKLNWLKLYNREDLYTTLVDKYLAKKIVEEKIGKEYIIPTLGVWDKFNDIDFNKLPNSFVMKTTHDSGGVVIVKDKTEMNLKEIRKKIKKSLKRDYYRLWREWPYKNVKRKIIIEEYIEDKKDKELRDYKFFCFNGKVELMFIASNRQNKDEETCFDFYDMNGEHLNIINEHPNAKTPPHLPINFEKMKILANKISNGIPHARIDFYEVNGKIYFGEITLFHFAGFVNFEPKEWNNILGDKINIKDIEKNEN